LLEIRYLHSIIKDATVTSFLPYRTNGRASAYATVLRPSVCRLSDRL